MTQLNRKEDAALADYEDLSAKFKGLISKSSDALAYINLKVIETNDTNLIIQVFGMTVVIRFSMVFQNKDMPLGQISALLINNHGTLLESESHLLSRWFDYLGNVRGAAIADVSGLHIDQNNYLGAFVYTVIQKLLSSSEMMPSENNG